VNVFWSTGFGLFLALNLHDGDYLTALVLFPFYLHATWRAFIE
jgi:hypothetical protein